MESQARASTRALTDSLDTQARLEELLEGSKPPKVSDPQRPELHWLLTTPFRYRPPLRDGTRFGARHEPAIWYGSEAVATAQAEASFHRLQALDHAPAVTRAIHMDMTVFAVDLAVTRGVDLCAPRFAGHRAVLVDRDDYGPCQALGARMRADHVLAFRFESVRDSEHRANLGAFSPRAFAQTEPIAFQSWRLYGTRDGMEWTRIDSVTTDQRRFTPAQLACGDR